MANAPFIQGFGDSIIHGMGTQFDVFADEHQDNLRGSDNTIMDASNAIRDAPLMAMFQTNEGIGDGTTRNIADIRAEADAGNYIGHLHNSTAEAARSALLINLNG
ncbi:hypothetical protein ACFCV3_08200 [Kribbella sp. NPDC056345]|uniref:hypothetical protein n=1 Tax=Kribbella sp. NPDC056345 TaxID=3345789 RepID=UPI0035E0EE67